MGCSSSKDTQHTQVRQPQVVQNEVRYAESPVSNHNPEFITIHSPEHSVVDRDGNRTDSPDEVQQEFELLVTEATRSHATKEFATSQEESDIIEEEWRKHLREQKKELLLEKLRVATYSRETAALEKVLVECCRNDDVKKHRDVRKGQEVLDLLMARDELRRAVHSRVIEDIEGEIENIKAKGYSQELKQDIVEARIVMEMIWREQNSHNRILTLDRKTMTEIRRYQSPPCVLHRVIQATLLLLGEDEYATEEWQTCQKLINPQGNSGLSRRFQNFSIKDVHPEICARAKYILLEEMFDIRTGKPVEVKHMKKKVTEEERKYWRTYDLTAIQRVSPTAVPFYIWCMGVIDEYEHDFGDDFDYIEPATKDRQVEIFQEQYKYFYGEFQPKPSQNTVEYISPTQDSYYSNSNRNSNTENSYYDYLEREN